MLAIISITITNNILPCFITNSHSASTEEQFNQYKSDISILCGIFMHSLKKIYLTPNPNMRDVIFRVCPAYKS